MVYFTLQVTTISCTKPICLWSFLLHFKEAMSFSGQFLNWPKLPWHVVGTCPNTNKIRRFSQTFYLQLLTCSFHACSFLCIPHGFIRCHGRGVVVVGTCYVVFLLFVFTLSWCCLQPEWDSMVGLQRLCCPFYCTALFPWLVLAFLLDWALENVFLL